MVCFVNENSYSKEGNAMATNRNNAINDLTVDDADFLDLKLQRVAGGSVIEVPPVFSPHGEALFIVCDDNIRVYSTVTGKFIRGLEGTAGRKIIGQQWDRNNSKLLYGCTESGDIISWKWKSGVVNEKQALRFYGGAKASVHTFNLIELQDLSQAYGLVTWRAKDSVKIQIGIFNLASGLQEDVQLPLKLDHHLPVKVAVSPNMDHQFALVQKNRLHCVKYLKKYVKAWKNIQGLTLTTVAFHPLEEIVATGDSSGRISVYYRIFEKCEPVTKLFHWHHTPITTVTFTLSGTNFYSGGLENTLAHWDINQDKPIGFVPRMQGTPVHVAIGAENQKIAVATDDNGIQIMNAQNHPLAVIQYFTWIPFDKTDVPKFPIGLQVNPRTTSLVFNGRLGHLQFYSSRTKSLLYNLDTTVQNRLNVETQKVLYNLYVSHASLNMNWLATAEILDDHERTIESRLKFWMFDEVHQTYVLNTQIELLHENGVRTLEFSTPYAIDNLLCASSGEFDVKIWALDDSTNYKRKNQIWCCIARTSYKNLPIKSLGFSTDTSLLGVGFGNTLCVYAPETLKLKCALSAPSGFDGSAGKLLVSIPTTKVTKNLEEKRNEFMDKRKKIVAAIQEMVEKNDTSIIWKHIKNAETCERSEKSKAKPKTSHWRDFTIGQQNELFNQILNANQLNLFQKIQIFDQINLRGRVPLKWKAQHEKYCDKIDQEIEGDNLFGRVMNLSAKHKFKMIHTYKKSILQRQNNRKISEALKKVVQFSNTNEIKSTTNGIGNSKPSKTEEKPPIKPFSPIQNAIVQIKHVAFCRGEHSHLVIVCTDNRLLIWNLLTLRLQSSYKISVSKIVVDIYTSLVAVVTKDQDLYVFMPNTPIPLYQHKGLQKIEGMAWIPRTYPRPHSLTIDWQASTELYFLSEKQELLRLMSSSDEESFNSNAFYLSDNLQPLPNTAFAAMIAKEQTNNATKSTNQDTRSTETHGIGVLGKNSVKELTTLQAHTMAPVSLMCTRFLKSLLVREDAVESKVDSKSRHDSDEDEDMNSDSD